jgi:hypothetical protein
MKKHVKESESNLSELRMGMEGFGVEAFDINMKESVN